MASIVSAGTTSATALNMSADTTGILQLASNNGTVALTVGTTQNVGIGTAGPARKLSVSNAGAQGFEFGPGVGAGSGNELLNYNRTTSLYVPLQTYASEQAFYTSTAGNVLPLFLSSAGLVGINTSTPSRRLTVISNSAMKLGGSTGALFTDSANDGGILIGSDYTFGNIQGCNAAGTAAKDITIQPEGGNVVIGGTSTSYKLHIVDQVDRNQSTAQLSITGSGYQCFHWLDSTAYYIGQNSNSRNLKVFSGGNNAIGAQLAAGGTSWGTYSDERMKDIIEPIANGLAKVLTLRAVIGKYKIDESDRRRVMMIAQDVKAVLPEAVTEDEEGMLSLAYTDVIPLLTAAIQELNAKVTALENK